MASAQLKETKDGRKYYRIFVSQGHGKPAMSTRWYVPSGLSERTIKSQLNKFMAQFEMDCESGNVKTRAEIKEQERIDAIERSKIKTFKQFAEQDFIPQKEMDCAIRSVEYYCNALKNHIYPVFGDRLINDISSAELNAFMLKEQKKGLSNSTIKGVHTTLSQVFDMAFMQDLIPISPMLKVKRPRVKKDDAKKKEDIIKALTEEQLNKVLECADNEEIKWQAFIYLMAYTGCRIGELCGIRWKSVDLKNGTIEICNNVVYSAEMGAVERATKTGESRIIPITNKKVIQILKDLRLTYTKKGIIPVYVFASQDDFRKPMFPQSPIRYIAKFSKKYALENMDLHCHLFRHTFATIAITNGMDIASVSKILGHSDITTTLKMYTHSNIEKEIKVAQGFSDALENYKVQ